MTVAKPYASNVTSSSVALSYPVSAAEVDRPARTPDVTRAVLKLAWPAVLEQV